MMDLGFGIWCSKGTVAQSTELSKSTVKRVFLQFLSEGIIVEIGRRNNSHGFTVEYCINLDKVAELPLTKDLADTAGIYPLFVCSEQVAFVDTVCGCADLYPATRCGTGFRLFVTVIKKPLYFRFETHVVTVSWGCSFKHALHHWRLFLIT